MAIYNREDPRTALPQLEKTLNGRIDEVIERIEVLENTDTKRKTISLGYYVSVGVLTGSAGVLQFSIPTGRVFPKGTTISKLTCNIVARTSSSNAQGLYIIKKTSGGTDYAPFDSTSSFEFYNAGNILKTMPATDIGIALEGETNIFVALRGDTTGTQNYFSGNDTTLGYINNNATTVMLSSIVVTLDIPK